MRFSGLVNKVPTAAVIDSVTGILGARPDASMNGWGPPSQGRSSLKVSNLLTNGQKLAALLVPQYQIDLWPTLSESTVTDPLTMIKERLPRPVFFDGPDRYDAL